ncbi:MAG: hypothetical protein K0U78_16325 [Actinomycetia bacterium]|nr:hypothetical protein [Actinomycetes bacterium]
MGDNDANLLVPTGPFAFVSVTAPAVGTNTLTLPAASAGIAYFVEAGVAGGKVDLDDQAGDTIMGGAGPFQLLAGATGIGTPRFQYYFVVAQDDTDWRVSNFTAVASGYPVF